MEDKHITASSTENQFDEQLRRLESHQSVRSHLVNLSRSFRRPNQKFPGNCGHGKHEGCGTDDKALSDDTLEAADGLARSKTSQSVADTLPLAREIPFVVVICSTQLLAQAGLGQGFALLHIVGDAFHMGSAELSWIVAGYSLTVGTFVLFSGRMGDLFGYKRMLLIGFSWYSLWSMVCGLSVYSNHVLFIFARAVQGIGPAIMLPNALAILGASYSPGMRKNMVFSFFGAVAPTGNILGSAGAALISLGWWPWAFWVQAIVLASVAVLGFFVIPKPPPKAEQHRSLQGKLEDLDLPGAVVGITSLVLINFAWNQAPIVGWLEPYVYVLLLIGIILIPVFFYVELRVSRAPLIPFHALNSNVSLTLACVACGWASFGSWYYYYWQITVELRGSPPLLVAAYSCPAIVTGTAAAVITGLILGRIGPARTMCIAMLAFTAGVILVATVPVHQVYWAQLFVAPLIVPFGVDMSFTAGTVILSDSVSKKHQGIAASLVATVVNYSISLGLGFEGTVEAQVNNGGVTPADKLKGYRGALYLGIGFASLGILTSLAFLVKTEVLGETRRGLGQDREDGRQGS